MKNLIIILSVLLASCTTTKMTISPGHLGREIGTAMTRITDYGYELVGENSDSRNEIITTGAAYSRYTGFSNLYDNQTKLSNSYTFSKGDSYVMFEVTYGAKADYNGNPYVYAVDVSKCHCDNVADYQTICGQIMKPIRNIKADQESMFYDAAGSYGLGIAIGLVLSLMVLAL